MLFTRRPEPALTDRVSDAWVTSRRRVGVDDAWSPGYGSRRSARGKDTASREGSQVENLHENQSDCPSEAAVRRALRSGRSRG